MKLVVITLVALTALVLALPAFAQTAGLSLSIPPNARANAMGEAGVAMSSDASAAWWNPGALGFLKRQDVNLTHAQLVPDLASDVFHEYLAYAMPVRGLGTFAASLVYLSYGSSEARGPSGEDLGTFTSYEIAPALSYGVQIADQVGVGVSFKYIREQLSPDFDFLQSPGAGTGSTVAADLGALWKLPVWEKRVALGMALQNLGPNITFVTNDVSDPIYRNLKAGFAANVYDKHSVGVLLVGDINQLLVRGEIEDAQGNIRRRFGRPIWNGGAEFSYVLSDIAVALRGGYVHDKDGSISDPTYGLGIGYKGFHIDFASIPQASDKENGTSLARVKKFSLGARF